MRNLRLVTRRRFERLAHQGARKTAGTEAGATDRHGGTDVPCDEPTNTLTVERGGRAAGNYAVSVASGLEADYGSEAAIRGSSAVDWVGEPSGIDRLRCSGRIRRFLLKDHAEVYRNGERADPEDPGR